MTRKVDSDTIHYDASVPVLQLKQAGGQGACGETGTVTGYAGAVTCKDCKPVAEADLQTLRQKLNGNGR